MLSRPPFAVAVAAAALLLSACSPEETPLSAEEYARPENEKALARMLEKCQASIIPDMKSPGCQAALQAKWAKEVEQTRAAARSVQTRDDVTGTTPK